MKIFNEVEKYIKLSDRDRIVLIQHLQLKKIKKGELISQQGQSNDFIGFVENGLLRSYDLDENGNDVTHHFFEEGSFFRDLSSYNQTENSYNKTEKFSVNIQALTDCELYILDSDICEDLENQIDGWTCMALRYYQTKLTCLLNFHSKIKNYSSEDAFHTFSKYYKLAVKESPKKHIASFLGMSKYTISRIRL